MTCVVGIRTNNFVYIGADSASIDDDLNTRIRLDSKSFKKGEFIFGFSGSFRAGQVLRYNFSIPNVPKNKSNDMFAYMISIFVPNLRKCFEKHGCVRKDDTIESDFLIGYKNKLYYIGVDFQISEYTENYAAIGSGASYALGSLYSTDGNPNSRIKLALTAASVFNAGVKPPFNIIKTS